MSKHVVNSFLREHLGGKKSGIFALFFAPLDRLILQDESAYFENPSLFRRMSTSSVGFGQITEMASPGSQEMPVS
jgi:hypothetical protein